MSARAIHSGNPPQAAGRNGGDAAPALCRAILADPARYQNWRAQKLAGARRQLAQPFVEIRDPAQLTAAELAALRARIAAMNFAFYRLDPGAPFGHGGLKRLCRQLGLRHLDSGAFAAASGISEIRAVARGARRGYIPYTALALGWHTDGYYNPPARRIEAFAMHTVRAARAGGDNQFIDHEILYLLLRERAPALAAELFAPRAMTIPRELRADGGRPVQSGPVFSFGADGRLRMRFTLHKRNVEWSPQTRAAPGAIGGILDARRNRFILTRQLAPGEGVVGNNVPHNRAAFAGGGEGRLVLRARFTQRVKIE